MTERGSHCHNTWYPDGKHHHPDPSSKKAPASSPGSKGAAPSMNGHVHPRTWMSGTDGIHMVGIRQTRPVVDFSPGAEQHRKPETWAFKRRAARMHEGAAAHHQGEHSTAGDNCCRRHPPHTSRRRPNSHLAPKAAPSRRKRRQGRRRRPTSLGFSPGRTRGRGWGRYT